jgi:hypothetical protein
MDVPATLRCLTRHRPLLRLTQAEPSTLLKSDNDASNKRNCADQEGRQFRQQVFHRFLRKMPAITMLPPGPDLFKYEAKKEIERRSIVL